MKANSTSLSVSIATNKFITWYAHWARVPVSSFFLAEQLGDWVLIESFVYYRKRSFYGNLLTRPFDWSSTWRQIWILSIKSFILVPNMAGFLAMVCTGTIPYQIMFVLRLSHTNNFLYLASYNIRLHTGRLLISSQKRRRTAREKTDVFIFSFFRTG